MININNWQLNNFKYLISFLKINYEVVTNKLWIFNSHIKELKSGKLFALFIKIYNFNTDNWSLGLQRKYL